MSARLSLAVAPDPHGRTRVVGLSYTFPLRTTSPMHLEAGDPGMSYVYLQNPSGALFDGDHHRIDVRLARDARLHLTTQSASRIAAAESSGTSQTLIVDLAPGSYLEHLPDALVPMVGARYAQDTTVRLRGDACYLGKELLSPGRVARGERLAFEQVRLVTTLERDDGARCRDAWQLRGGRAASRAGVLGGNAYVGTLLAVGPAHLASATGDALQSVADRHLAVMIGVSRLPSDLGTMVRLLGERPTAIRSALDDLADSARLVLAGLPSAVRRK